MEGLLLGNRYELMEKIGGGGMAIVYKAKCRLLNRFVAVKILRDEFTDDEEFVKRFRIEAQAAASLSHPNIVPIFDVGHENNMHYIVMEYIDGITLKEYISEKGVLSWKEAVNIAIQICSAIEHAHKNHIVHRDIKPHNILITREGIAKVTDFGIARAVSSSTITMVGSTIGSVHYFSPEQARGGFTDEKSDLYSLGITIYEMITGRVPFDGDSPVAVALKHIQDKAERPADINQGVPRAVNDIVMKAIRKDQSHRYQSASDLLADLQKTIRDPNSVFVADSGHIEGQPTRKVQTVGDVEFAGDREIAGGGEEKPMKKKRDRLSIILGIITALIIGGIFFYIGIRIVVPIIVPEKPQDFVVASYVNQSFMDVQASLEKAGIKAVEIRRVHSDAYDKDIITWQSVAEGDTLKPESGEIEFEVSDGPELIAVPNIVGKEFRVGETMLAEDKFVMDHITENSESVPTGFIIRTEPAIGEMLKPGSTVTVVESLGPELKQVKMPDLSGLTRVEAEKKIEENGLKLGKILPEGIVNDIALIVKQYPLANTIIDEGTAVEMTFDVEGTTTTDTAQTSAVEGSTPEMIPLTITLDDPDKYGDEITVYVEATPSDTNELSERMNEKVAKDKFPVTVLIPKSKNGTTHVIVSLDGKIVHEDDY